MLKKFYIKFILFVVILFLSALIIDAKTKTVGIPILSGEQVNFEEKVDAKVTKEYNLFVSDFKNNIFPINIVLDKDENEELSQYQERIQTDLDETIYTTFSLLTNYSNYLPTGVTTLIPPSTQLNSYKLKNGELTLDVSNSFLNYNEQKERNIFKILTYTFTDLNDVKTVRILSDGQEIEFKTTDESTFSRSNFALNVHFNQNNINDAKIYTVYYFTELNKEMFLVPVTVYENANTNKEDAIKSLLLKPNSSSVISLIDETEYHNYKEAGHFIDEFDFYQYYFTLTENNIMKEKDNLSLKNINFYKIDLLNE